MLNPLSLEGRTVLVTGASSGIGREAALLLSRLGARVVLVARRAEELARVLEGLEGSGHRAEPFDLLATDEIPAWLKRIAAEVGPLHAVVHCAGIQIPRALRFLGGDEVADVMKINVGAGLSLARAFRQKGAHTEDGRVVFLASVMGLVGQPLQASYCASKGAIVAMTKALALELAREGIRVNCIAPGVVETEMAVRLLQTMSPEQVASVEAMHPLGKGTPLDVAYAIAYLVGDTGRWVTGTTLVVDGGYTSH